MANICNIEFDRSTDRSYEILTRWNNYYRQSPLFRELIKKNDSKLFKLFIENFVDNIWNCYSVSNELKSEFSKTLTKLIVDFSNRLYENRKIILGGFETQEDVLSFIEDTVTERIDALSEDSEEENEELTEGKINSPQEISYLGKLIDLLGKQSSIVTYFKTLFFREMRLELIFSGRRGIVSKLKINDNIARYKNNKYKLLRNYLLAIEQYKNSVATTPKNMYVRGQLQENYEQLLLIARKVFFGENFDTLSDEAKNNAINEFCKDLLYTFRTRNKEGANDKLLAYLNFVMFNPGVFDDMIKFIFLDNIKILKKYPGETNANNMKYQLVEKGKYATGWSNDEENKEALTQIGRILEILIGGTQLISYRSKNKLETYLSTKSFLNFWQLVRERAIAQDDLDTIKAFSNFRDNPLVYASEIVQRVLNNPKIYTPSLLTLATTIWNEFLDPNNINSLHFHTLANFNIQKNTYTLLDSLVGMVDRMSETSYLMYEEDNESQSIVSKKISITSKNRKLGILKGKLNGLININRISLLNEHNVQIVNDGFGNVSFDLKLANGKTYKFTYSGANRGLDITLDGKHVIISDIVDSELNNEELVAYGLSDRTFSDGLGVSKRNTILILEFIDNVLGTKFTSGEGDKFTFFAENASSISIIPGLEKLLKLTQDALSASAIRRAWLDSDQSKSLSEFIKTLKFFSLIDSKNIDKYFDSVEDVLKIDRLNSAILDELVHGQMLADGDFYASMVNGVNGNNVAKMKKLTLAQSIDNMILKLSKFPVYLGNILTVNAGVIKDCVITNGIKLRGESKIAKEFNPAEWIHTSFVYDYLNEVFTGGSYLCMPVVYSDKTTFFKYRIAQNFNVLINGDIMPIDLQASTNSDLIKAIYLNRSQSYREIYNAVNEGTTKILKYIIENSFGEELAKDILNEQLGKPLTSKIGKRLEVIRKSKGIDDNTKNRIELAWNAIKSKNIDYSNYEIIRGLMNLISEEDFNRAAFNVKVKASENLYYQKRKYKDVTLLDTNVSLHFLRTLMYNAENRDSLPSKVFIDWFNNLKKRAIIHMLLYGNYFELDIKQNDEENTIGDSLIFSRAYKQLATIDPSLKSSDWEYRKRLIFAKAVLLDGRRINITNALLVSYLDNAISVEFNPLIERYLATDTLVSYDLRLTLVGSELLHPNKASNLSQRKLLYETYDNSDDMLDLVMLDVNLMDLSSAKRTVNIGATISQYQRGNILGIPTIQRRAIMYDIIGKVFGPSGQKDKVDAHDGGSKGHPLEMRLRNLSLLNELIAGTISKSIEISSTESGALILDKYALHGMTNQEIRDSQGSEMNLLNLVRRMSSIRFYVRDGENWKYHTFDSLDKAPDELGDYTLDLTKDIFGKAISLQEITKGKAYYYDPDLNKYFLLVELVKSDDPDPRNYLLTVQECDSNGQRIQGSIQTVIPKKINTLYDLWQTFGGCYSMTKSIDLGGEEKLEYSDFSWDIVTIYVNSVGKYYGLKDSAGNISEIPSQYNTWQPLKHKFIGALDVKSAVKSGGYAFNPVSKYRARLQGVNDNGEQIIETDEDYEAALENNLATVEQDTTFSGELLDATHIIEDGDIDVTQPTLVMAALENGGYSHDIVRLIYRALGLQVINERGEILTSIETIVKEIMQSSGNAFDISLLSLKKLKSLIYEILAEIGIRAAKGDDFGSLQASIARVKEVLKKHNEDHADDPIHLPLSDSTLFLKLVADYTSSINKRAIKHRSAGFAAVISPSYKMLLLYRIPHINQDGTMSMLTYTYSEIELLAIAEYKDSSDYPTAKNKVDAYLLKLHNKQETQSLAAVLPGLNIVVVDEKGAIVGKYNTEDWDIYKLVKDLYQEHPDYKFKMDILKPSDLLPMRVLWSDGKNTYNFYDIPIIRTIFDIRNELGDKLTKKQNIILTEYVLSVLNVILSAKDGNDIVIPTTMFETATQFVPLSDKLSNLSEDELSFIKNVGLPTNIGVRQLNNKEKVIVLDAELIVANLYAERFGMTYNTPLNEVLQLGPNYFRSRYKELHKIDPLVPYNICLTRSSGKHTYIVKLGSFLERKFFMPMNDPDNYKRVGNKYIRIDNEGNHLYLAGYFDKDNILHILISEHISSTGDTILVLEDSNQLLLFLDKNDYDDIRINVKTDAESALLFEDIIVKKHSNYALLFTTLKRVNLSVKKYIKGDIDGDQIREELKDVDSEIIETLIKNVESIKQDKRRTSSTRNSALSRELKRILNTVYKNLWNNIFNDILERDSKLKFAAFLKSRNYIAARIPALTLQSFMKMKVVAFVQGLLNNAYVSRYQTWLLGSDYDIDKAYLIGHEFTSSGKYLSHSPLAVLDSEYGIELSETIPVPDSSIVFKLVDDGIDITEDLLDLHISNKNKRLAHDVHNLKIFIRILLKVKSGRVSFSNDVQNLGKKVIELLNKHNRYFEGKDYRTLEKILNNIATSGIERVISAPVNYNFSHTPIDISSPRNAAENSTLGKEAANTTLSNAIDRFLLTYQNMTGRNVIGIAAIAEKIFFGATHVLNEAAKSGSDKDFKNLLFMFKFKTKLLNDSGEFEDVEIMRLILANVNFNKRPDTKKIVIDLIKQKLSGKISLEQLNSIIKEQFLLTPDLALIISLLLSAATDNAKELILEKINSGSLTAGIYMTMIMLGIDFETIAKYMTGPLVSTIANMGERQVNILNSSTSKSRNLIRNLANALLGEINVLRFLDWNDVSLLASMVGDTNDTKHNDREKVEEFIKKVIQRDISFSLINTTTKNNVNIQKLQDYLDEIFLIRKKLKKVYGSDLNRELLLFIEISRAADETTLLGRILSSNLGMKTNATELINWIESINDHVSLMLSRLEDRICEFNKDAEKDITYILVDDPETYHTKEEISQILDTAIKYDIIDNFDITKFIFGNEEYKLAAKNYYSLVLHLHNILEVIDNIPFVLANLKQFCGTNLMFRTNIATYRITEKVIKAMKNKLMYVDVSKRSSIEQFTIGTLIRKFLLNYMNAPEIKLSEGLKYFNVVGDLQTIEKGDELFINFKTIDGLATFKYWVEQTLFDLLKTSNNPKLKKNKFILELNLDNGQRDKVTRDKVDTLVVSDLDMMSEFNEALQALYDEILNAFSELEGFTLQDLGIDSNAKLIDIIALYNLIVNKNLAGSSRLTRIIFDLINNKGVKIESLENWNNFVGTDLDYNEIFSILETPEDLNDWLEDLSYYLATTKSSKTRLTWDYIHRRYSALYKYKGVDGKTLYIDFASSYTRSKNMSNYFLIDLPITRLKRMLYQLLNLGINNSAEILKSLILRNILQITYYCE